MTRGRMPRFVPTALMFSILLAINPTWHRNLGQGAETDAQKEFNALTTALANGSVATIDVLHMPDAAETRVSVRPELLEKWFESRVTINKVGEWGGRDELVKVMKAGEVATAQKMPDLRSAIIFYDSKGARIGAIYFSRFFRAEGAAASLPVAFKGDLPGWLKQMIPSPLR
jgi:hypothetical protein